MGTRNLTCVVLNGEFKIAQYCQWDGYPAGQGLGVLNFLQKEWNPSVFAAKVLASQEIDKADLKSKWESVGADDSGWVGLDIADKFAKNWPHLNRDFGSDILKYVQDEPPGVRLKIETNFAADSLFCEWLWLIDLDRGTFEAYRGFNQNPLAPEERFHFLEKEADGEYHPVNLVAAWKLDNLPDEGTFLFTFKEPDDKQDIPAQLNELARTLLNKSEAA